MTGILKRCLAGVTISAACGAGLALAGAPAAVAAAPKPGWSIAYHLPAQGGSTDDVNAIAATGPGSAWAVGGKLAVVNGQAEGVPAVFHWNGKAWAEVRLPGPVHVGYFSAVSAPSASDVWAIGGCDQGCGEFAANWNGKKWTWHSSAATAPDSAMAAFSASDVWVADYTHLDRWTGRSWRTYAAPGWNGVWTIAGTARNNLWAGGLAPGGLQPELLHWNGVSWRAAKLPTLALPVNGQAEPEGIAADAAADVWADGIIQYPQTPGGLTAYKPFVLHWNGVSWRQAAVPSSFPANFGLGWVASDGAGGFWADATQPSASATSLPEKLVHYSKGKWTITSLPAIPGSGLLSIAPEVDDLAQVPGTGQLWAPVFYDAKSGAPRDAILHYRP